jgi:adenylylsulfate kinase
MPRMNERNLTWHPHAVPRGDRERIFAHKGACVWLTGLSGSGKSTIGNRVDQLLAERRVRSFVLDGDNVRQGLSSDLGFDAAARSENIRRIGEVAKLFVEAGVVVITAFISPFREDRARVRARMGPGDFVEVWVAAPLEVCEARDPKGLYRKARAGEMKEMTGIDSPYEEPGSPEVVVRSDQEDVEASAQRVVRYLEERGYLSFTRG